MMRAAGADRERVQSLEDFLLESGENREANVGFGNESERTLRIDVDGSVWLKPGAGLAYRGDLTFVRLPTIAARSLKDAALREIAPLVRAVGRGRLFCGHHGAHAHVLRLAGETIVVKWQDLLAFEDSLAFETILVRHGVGIAAGGLVVVRVSGCGALALATHGRPLALRVTPDDPVSTDPHATIAWSADLTPILKTDLSWRSALAHGGHEPIQLLFRGTGFVMVQPFEDPRRFKVRIKPLERLAALLAG